MHCREVHSLKLVNESVADEAAQVIGPALQFKAFHHLAVTRVRYFRPGEEAGKAGLRTCPFQLEAKSFLPGK